MTESINKFKSINGGIAPKKVIVYRDGVSEHQKQAILKSEVEQIERAIKSSSETEARLIYIIVNKRVSARFFE